MCISMRHSITDKLTVKKTNLASKVRAMVADTRGVEALVPVKPSVHPLLRSSVVLRITQLKVNKIII